MDEGKGRRGTNFTKIKEKLHRALRRMGEMH
jgi:hypothetical protein